MEHTDKKLEAIKSLLQNHEEAYKEGSWESFSKQIPSKKKTVGWVWISGIAASILLIGLILLSNYNPQDKQIQLTAVKMKTQQKEMTEKVDLVKPYKAKQPTRINKKTTDKLIVATAFRRQNKPETEAKPEDRITAETPPGEVQVNAAQSKKHKNMRRYPISPVNEADKKKYVRKENNWMLGMAMATEFSNSKKMGIGFEAVVGYALNPKITIMLGAGYRETSGFRENDTQTLSASDEKQLESASVRLTGVELPLALRYNVNKRLYAKVGVSAFATIKQSGELTYRSSVTHVESLVDPNGEVYDKTVITEVKSVVNLEEEHQHKENYKSFVNISFGYRYPLFKNKMITLEPFVKFPMQSPKIENVKLSAAGLRLGIDL